MLIELDLNINDCEALLRHCESFKAATGDTREDSRLNDALETVAEAIQQAIAVYPPKTRD